jgi:hypothetical protein
MNLLPGLGVLDLMLLALILVLALMIPLLSGLLVVLSLLSPPRSLVLVLTRLVVMLLLGLSLHVLMLAL